MAVADSSPPPPPLPPPESEEVAFSVTERKRSRMAERVSSEKTHSAGELEEVGDGEGEEEGEADGPFFFCCCCLSYARRARLPAPGGGVPSNGVRRAGVTAVAAATKRARRRRRRRGRRERGRIAIASKSKLSFFFFSAEGSVCRRLRPRTGCKAFVGLVHLGARWGGARRGD